MNKEVITSKILHELGELSSDILGGVVGHFIVNKLENGQPVMVEGKPVKMLDPKKLRVEAPHFAKTNEDEAGFNAMVVQLAPGLQKNLEEKMALTNIGHHQRDDIVLTIVDIERVQSAEQAIKVLTQLAEVFDAAEWKRRASSFKLMKDKETDYIGARIGEGVGKLFLELVRNIRIFDRLARREAKNLDRGTDQILRALEARQRRSIFTKFFTSFTRATALPWDEQETAMCDRNANDRDTNTTHDSNESNDCGNNNPRRSKLGLSLCGGGKFYFDFGGYRQRAVKDDLPTTTVDKTAQTTLDLKTV